MKLKIEYINEETGEKLIVKNIHSRVFYHNSEVHDSKEFEELTGKAIKFGENEKNVINTFYKLAGEIS